MARVLYPLVWLRNMTIEDLFLANFSRADPQTLPEVQELITEANEALEKLKTEAYSIIERTNPITWAPFVTWFNTDLHRVLNALFQRLGVTMIIPPLTYPDGITSTSELTQSEMVQFVTNTLDTWQGTLLGLIDQYTGDQAELIRQLQRRIAELEALLAESGFPAPKIIVYKKLPATITIHVPAPEVPTPAITLRKGGRHTYTLSVPAPEIPTPSLNIYKEV